MRTIFLLFLLALIPFLAMAGDATKRKYSFDAKGKELFIKAELSEKAEEKDKVKKGDVALPELPSITGKKTKDKLEWRIQSTSSGLKIRLKWMSKTEDTNEKVMFNTYFKSIIEYDCRDCGGECCPYDAAQDTVFTVRNDLNTWSNAQYTGCEGEGEDLECKAVFTTQDGKFSVQADINIAGLTEGDLALSNNDLKLTVTENYPLQSGSNSALAILGHAESNVKSKTRTKDEASVETEDAVETEENDESVAVVFSWLNGVTCGGTERKVLPVVKDGSADLEEAGATSGKTVGWSILKTSGDGECVWDPVIEFQDGRFCWDCYSLYMAFGVLLLAVSTCVYCCCCRNKKGNDQPNSAPARFTSV